MSFQKDPPCVYPATIYFDVFLDIFFLLEIAYTFFGGRNAKRACFAQKCTTDSRLIRSFPVGVDCNVGGYTDDPLKVAYAYMGGNFCFDLVTSIPGSLVEFLMMQASLFKLCVHQELAHGRR